MSNDRKITHTPISRRVGMTVAELSAFVGACRRVGVHPDSPVRIENGLRGQIQRISAELPPEDLDRLEAMLRSG